MNFATLPKEIREATETELTQANELIVEEIRRRRRNEERKATAQFDEMDVVEFDSSRGLGTIRMQIERVNEVTVTGFEMVNGRATSKKWKVSPSMLRKVA